MLPSMDSVKGFLGLGEPEPVREPSLLNDINDALTMSRTQRFYGFLICMSAGLLCSFLAALYLPSIIVNPRKFALVYTLGNVLSIGSTMFLVGPWEQLRKMMAPTRLGATVVYVVSLGLTLYCALVLHSSGLTLVCLVIQIAAMIWYALSYVPFGRQLCTMCCENAMDI
eukprot:ANDGO_07847.mRNA.1 Protein transport protein SFT2